jgi:anti-anti-sigma factor
MRSKNWCWRKRAPHFRINPVDDKMTSTPAVNNDALRIDGEMTIYRAVELKEMLFASAAASRATALDLSAVTELDTAGVQLLLLAQRAARARGVELTLQAPSAAALEVLQRLGLEQMCTDGEAVK